MNDVLLKMMLQKLANNSNVLNNPMFVNAMKMYRSGDQKCSQDM